MINLRGTVTSLALLLAVALIGLGCSSAPAAAPTAVPESVSAGEEGVGHQEPAADQEDAEVAEHEDDHQEAVTAPATELLGSAARGLEAFRTVGCAACHGLDGEGTPIAPALAGHSEAQVRRQVRAPVGAMLAFPSDTVTDAQLDDLVAYVTGIQGGHGHMKASDLGADMEMHHWMALTTVENGNIVEAVHHVQHIVELTEGDHQARMTNVLSALEAGRLHDAAHDIEAMLAGVLGDGAGETVMHLQLALSSTRLGDTEAASHHLTHFREVAPASDLAVAESALSLMSAGDLTGAEHEIVELLEARGVEVGHASMEGMDAHSDAEAEEGEDAHGDDAHSDAEAEEGHAQEEGEDAHGEETEDAHEEAEDAHGDDAHEEEAEETSHEE